MAQGLKLPLETRNGRLVQLSGDDYIEQLVSVMLGDGESDNPFQDLGLGEFMVFGINDAVTDGEIKERVVRGFAILERDQLARLDNPDTDLVFRKGDSPGERILEITYTNMETQERPEIEVPIPPAAE